MECAVCFESIENKLSPCQHSVCEVCFIKWIKKGHIDCPVCRQTICVFTQKSSCDHNVVVNFCEHKRPGLTIRNCEKGCIITKVTKKEECYISGLRRGYVIESINGFSCKDIGSTNVAKILTQASLCGVSCYLNIHLTRIKKIQYTLITMLSSNVQKTCSSNMYSKADH